MKGKVEALINSGGILFTKEKEVSSTKCNGIQVTIEDNLTKKRETFLEFLSPVQSYLYNFILKSLNFSVQGEDLFQDVLLKAFRYFDSFDRKRSFKTWLFTIAHNLIKDYYQKNSSQLITDSMSSIEFRDNSLQPRVSDIYTVAENLKPRQREIFFLYYDSEFKVSEIASVTGLSKPNVKFILNQARKAIKKILEV